MKIIRIEADWCPECVIFMKPVWDEISREFPDIVMEVLNYDKDEEIKTKYNISKVPTFVFLNDFEDEIVRRNGIISKKEIIEIIKQI
ncbi:MAG: thioredoxin family protein [Patescibacteria group bacterium]|nr:thioredoxin family protein [Patescibacteria group bacterium]